ncbi:MAG: neuraminidase-like domain-containing protein [Nitrospiraceae bacterium]
MNLQGRNLNEGLAGDDVAVLQQELTQLRFTIARPEIDRKFFGATTKQAVLDFQQRHGLPATGIVDEATARRINAEVDRLGPRPESEGFVVRGTVLNPDGSPVARAIAKAFDIGLRIETPLGEAPTGADGKYAIRYRRDQLRPEGKHAADLIVRAYDEAGNELAHSERLCRAPAEAVVDLVVGNRPLRGPSEYDALLARVRPYLGRTALADLERADVHFLACSAEVDRRQVATLIVANRLAREASVPDWLFYALGRQGMLLHLSALLGHSLKNLRESIERAIASNIVAPLVDAAELDRWIDRLRSVLLTTAFKPSPEPGRLSMGELLGASLVSREVQEAFLSRYLARAGSLEEFWRNLEEDNSFDPAAREDLRFTLHLGMLTQYHAPLMRQLKDLRQRGEFKSLRDLAGFDRTRWRRLLEASVSGGDITLPPDTPGQTPEERLNHYITTLREPIEALFPSDSLRHALARTTDTEPTLQTFLTNTPKLDLYWTNIDDFLTNAGDSAFTGIADDQRAHVVDEVKTMQRLLRMAPSADQVRILRQAGFTSAYAIARSSRRKFRARFAQVAEELKDSLDGAYMVLSPATDGGPGGDTQMMLLSGKAPEKMADINYNQASGKAAASLDCVVNGNALAHPWWFAIGGSKEAQEQAKKEFFKKNPNWETLFGSLSYCECKHCRSVYSPAAYFVDLLHWLDNLDKDLKNELKHPDALNAKTADGKAKAPISVLLSRRPDLQEILLTCENTNTTLPYIDLVNEALESFVFTHLKVIPNIDPNQPVGLEWSDGPVGSKTLQARDTGDAKSEELRAVPQYIIPEVYEHLATKAIYPMTLPFHRPLEVVRTYLGHLGTSRAEIMEVFRTGSPPSPPDEDISGERLALSKALADIITASGGPGSIGNKSVWLYYGLANEGELQSKLVKVPEFLSRTGLSMEELVALLKTRFINPHLYDPPQPVGKIINIEVDPKDPCDVSSMTLKNLTWTDSEVPDKYEWLKRVHRFLRLWRTLSWSMADVDRAIHTFGDKLDAAALQSIENLQWLKKELKQPVENLIAFWGKLDTWGLDSLYDRLFLGKGLVPTNADPAVATSPSIFALAADRTELATEISNTPEALEKHLPAAFAALQLTMADYEAIKDVETFDVLQPPTDPTQPALTLRNLSLLYRYGVLARTLKLRVKDIATLNRLVPDDHYPFHGGDPAATRRFVQLARAIQETDFSVPLLNYLFRHEEEPTRHPAPTRILVFNTLKAIADGLAQVEQETQPGEDPLGEELRKQLSLLTPLLTALNSSGEENKYIKPEEIQHAIDMIDWRRENFNASAGEMFIQKLHDTLMKDLQSSFLDPVDAKTALFGPPQPTTSGTKAERFANNVNYLRDKLLPWLRERLQRSLVFQTLAAALDLDEAVTKTLLDRVLDSTATPSTPGQPQSALTAFLSQSSIDKFLTLVTEQGGPQAFDVLNYKEPPVLTFVRVFKAAHVAKAFEMTEVELTYLSDNGSLFGAFDLNTIPLKPEQSESLPKQLFLWWIELERFFSLRNSLPKSERTLVDYLNDMKAVSPLLEDKTLATLVEATGWEDKQIEELEGEGFKRDTVEALAILQRAIHLLKRVGASATQLSAWAKDEPNHEQANAVIETVKARYDRAQWLEVARSLNDPLREKQRMALVDFLVARMKKEGIETANDLLGHFLIDIEMSSCMLTSRIKQAISSVQLFIQRCLLNLEKEVSPAEIDADQWKWMKNYRVWEANRKVFLYPENWIEPELRDDKSPFFKDLETELLQNELTDQAVETALVNYLYKLDEVARLDIRGFCKEETDGGKEIYHVFGRTWNPPYVYYYRRGIFPKDGPVADEWTAWERVDVDIQGDHLIPFLTNGRLYLFWLIFDRKPLPTASADQSASSEDGASNDSSPPKEQWQLRMCWSEYDNGRWSSKAVGKSILNDGIRSLPEQMRGLEWRSDKEGLAQDLDTTDPEVVNVPARYGARISSEGQRIVMRVGEEELAFIPWGGVISSPFGLDDELNFVSVGSFVLSPCRGQLSIRKDKNWTIYGPLESTSNGLVIISRHKTLRLPHVEKDDILIPNVSVFKEPPRLFMLVPPDLVVPNNPWLMSWFPFFFRDNNASIASSYFARPVLEKVTIPQDTATWKESTVTIGEPPMTMKVAWQKPIPDPAGELSGLKASGV